MRPAPSSRARWGERAGGVSTRGRVSTGRIASAPHTPRYVYPHPHVPLAFPWPSFMPSGPRVPRAPVPEPQGEVSVFQGGAGAGGRLGAGGSVVGCMPAAPPAGAACWRPSLTCPHAPPHPAASPAGDVCAVERAGAAERAGGVASEIHAHGVRWGCRCWLWSSAADAFAGAWSVRPHVANCGPPPVPRPQRASGGSPAAAASWLRARARAAACPLCSAAAAAQRPWTARSSSWPAARRRSSSRRRAAAAQGQTSRGRQRSGSRLAEAAAAGEEREHSGGANFFIQIPLHFFIGRHHTPVVRPDQTPLCACPGAAAPPSPAPHHRRSCTVRPAQHFVARSVASATHGQTCGPPGPWPDQVWLSSRSARCSDPPTWRKLALRTTHDEGAICACQTPRCESTVRRLVDCDAMGGLRRGLWAVVLALVVWSATEVQGESEVHVQLPSRRRGAHSCRRSGGCLMPAAPCRCCWAAPLPRLPLTA